MTFSILWIGFVDCVTTGALGNEMSWRVVGAASLKLAEMIFDEKCVKFVTKCRTGFAGLAFFGS